MMQTPNWDDIRLFLAVAREGQLLAAARRLALDHTTVGRRITSLEEDMGQRLFDRSTRGVLLTEAGTHLLDHAERIEAELLSAQSALGVGNSEITGSVRLATPEAFGTYMVAPNVAALRERHPGLQLELAPENRAVSLSKREADIAITLNRPKQGRVIARKLVDYHLGLYACRNYLEQHGPITSTEDLQDHPLVWYIDDLIDLPELRRIDQFLDARSVFRSSSIVAQQAAVAHGVGLGMLHDFAARQDPRLVRILPGCSMTRTYWLVLSEDMRKLPKVRATLEFVDDLVAKNRSYF